MDTAYIELILGFANALAWPVLILILVFILRKPILSLIPLIEKIKVKDVVEVNFGKRVEQVASQAADILPKQDSRQIDEWILDLTDSYPKGAMIESWLAIERELTDLAEASQIKKIPSRRSSPRQIARALVEAEVIDASFAEIISEMQSIRNKIVHTSDISPTREIAQHYVTVASRVIAALREERT